MATLPLKASCKRNSVLLFIFCGQQNLSQMPFTLRYMQYMVACVLQDQQYMFRVDVRSLLLDKKSLLMKKDLADVLFWRLLQRSQQSYLSYGLTGVWSKSVQINLDNMLSNIAILDLPNAISRKRCKIGAKLLLITNKKSQMSSVILPNSVAFGADYVSG